MISLRGGVCLRQLDIERGQARRADHDDVLDSGVVRRRVLLIVVIPKRH